MHGQTQTTTLRPAHRAAVPVLVTLALGLAAWAYLRGGAAGGAADDGLPYLAKVHTGEPASAFKGVTLTGHRVDFPADYRGKLVLVDFWATWCPPCRAEFPHLVEAYEKYRERGFEIVGVSLDQSSRVSAERVQQFLRENGASWAVIHEDATAIAGDYRVAAIPAAFLVDGTTGRILARGDRLRGHALLETIDAALSAGSSE